MNKKIIVIVIIVVVIVIGILSFFMNNTKSTETITTPPVATETQIPTSTASASSSIPLMKSSTDLFSKYKYYSKAHEVFPTLAADTKKAMGAFGYKKEDLGNNVYKFTLTNNAEGYNGQSVIVGGDQFLYFIEPAAGDDSASEDSMTKDDFFVVVDAKGFILK